MNTYICLFRICYLRYESWLHGSMKILKKEQYDEKIEIQDGKDSSQVTILVVWW